MITFKLQMFGRLLGRGGGGMLTPLSCSISQGAHVHHHLERHDLRRFLGIERSNKARANRNTNHNERLFRRMRGRKTLLLDLPEEDEQRAMDALPPHKMRIAMLKKGINPYREVQPREWQEMSMTMQSFHQVIDPYVTNEAPMPYLPAQLTGSAIMDAVKAKGTEARDFAQHKWHNWRNGTSRIRKKEGFEKFDPKTFGPTADVIYEEAHAALMARDTKALHSSITELAYAKMWPDIAEGSIIWKLNKRIEPSKVVAVRCSDNPYKSGNDIAQVTVRMHLRQILAMYDRFGHLQLGSETEPRDTVEYVVFEHHISSIDGKWRLHDKVYPRWSAKKEPSIQTSITSEEDRVALPENLPLRIREKLEQQKHSDKAEQARKERESKN